MNLSLDEVLDIRESLNLRIDTLRTQPVTRPAFDEPRKIKTLEDYQSSDYQVGASANVMRKDSRVDKLERLVKRINDELMAKQEFKVIPSNRGETK